MSEAALDRTPFYWALGIVAVLAAAVAGMYWFAQQRLHNTLVWQHWNPVTMKSAPQTATPVEVQDTRRQAFAVVQTERGLYFLTGARHVPATGTRVIVEANARWDLFLCAEDGDRCMTIHSFCADTQWPNIQRDEQGRVANCDAPHLGPPISDDVLKRASVAPLAAVPGGMGKRKPPPPAVGVSHPQEWAWRMGLPVGSR